MESILLGKMSDCVRNSPQPCYALLIEAFAALERSISRAEICSAIVQVLRQNQHGESKLPGRIARLLVGIENGEREVPTDSDLFDEALLLMWEALGVVYPATFMHARVLPLASLEGKRLEAEVSVVQEILAGIRFASVESAVRIEELLAQQLSRRVTPAYQALCQQVA